MYITNYCRKGKAAAIIQNKRKCNMNLIRRDSRTSYKRSAWKWDGVARTDWVIIGSNWIDKTIRTGKPMKNCGHNNKIWTANMQHCIHYRLTSLCGISRVCARAAIAKKIHDHHDYTGESGLNWRNPSMCHQ